MFVRSLKTKSNVMRTIIGQQNSFKTQPLMNVRAFAAAVEESASVKNVTGIDADAPINFQPGQMTELENEKDEPRFLEQV